MAGPVGAFIRRWDLVPLGAEMDSDLGVASEQRQRKLLSALFWAGIVSASSLVVLVPIALMIQGVQWDAAPASSTDAQPNASSPLTAGVFVQQNVCPGEGCSYGRWPAIAETRVFARAENGAPIVARVARGEWVEALRGDVHIVPVRGRARDNGDVVYRLAYSGEGWWSVWRSGRIYHAPESDFDFGANAQDRDEGVWWVRIRRSDGSEGWIRDTQNFGCTSRYSEHPAC